jgi:hypothetical protein
MSERQGITAEEVREIAAGAVTGWAPGWTGDDGVNPQRRVRVAGFGDGYVDLRVEGAPFTDEPDRLFRVMMVVTEIPPVQLRPCSNDLAQFNPYQTFIAPVETGEPFRSAAEREWDDSRGD